jgi:hypothetical protein
MIRRMCVVLVPVSLARRVRELRLTSVGRRDCRHSLLAGGGGATVRDEIVAAGWKYDGRGGISPRPSYFPLLPAPQGEEADAVADGVL